MISFDSVSKFVLSDVTVHIPPGITVGLIGASGAGKTTFLKLACGLLVPAQGEVFTMRKNPVSERQKCKNDWSVLFADKPFLNKEDTVCGNFKMLGEIYRIKKAVFDEDYAELSEKLGFGTFQKELVKDLSLGQRRRTELGAALLQRPKLLLLDEPASGLDETAKQAFGELLDKRKKETGMTVLLTSHDMAEISRLCDRIAFLHEGKLLFYGKEEMLQRRFLPQEKMQVKVLDGMPDLEDLPIEKLEFAGGILQLFFRADVITAAEILQFLLRKSSVTEVSICKPKLEDIVAGIVKEREAKKENRQEKEEEEAGNERIY